MNKQKNLIKITLIIVTLTIISLGVYFTLVKKSSVIQKAELLTFEQNTPIKIHYSGEWKEVVFPQRHRHTINTLVPASWEFDCCADTDSFSSLSIFPLPSNKKGGPSIAVTEFVLISCPESFPGCSPDEALRLSSAQFMINKIKELDADSRLTKKDSIKLPNFSTDVVVYNGLSYAENQPLELYLIKTPNGVVKIEFQQSDKFESSFKTEFLNKLTSN